MNRKIFVIIIITFLMLMAISLASAINSNTIKQIKKNDSPLFGIRTRRAIREKIVDFIKTRFIGERVFFLPFQWLRNREDLSGIYMFQKWTDDDFTCKDFTHPRCFCDSN